MSEDGRLLRLYREQGSEAAFAALVARHLGLVYAVCLRETGDAALAEDAAQVVFLLLARKAHSFGPDARLSGWLFQTARFAGRNARRRDASRRLAEQRVGEQMLTDPPQGHGTENALWAGVEPGLNDALASLEAKDREAVLLRFGQGLTFPELGAALGTSEDAARMRLTRALARLRRFFAGQGVPITAVALATLLAARTAHAAPTSCAASVLASLGGPGVSTLSPAVSLQLQGALKTMTKVKVYASVALVLALAAAGGVLGGFGHTSARALGTAEEGHDPLSISAPLSPDPAVREEAHQRQIDQAKLLRARWQPWAEAHRELLTRMLRAQPADTEILARVYEAIPDTAGPGDQPGVSGISSDDLHRAGALFTWNASARRTPATSNAWYDSRKREDFSQYHDFRLAEAVSTGNSHAVLWASGRVTVMSLHDRPAKRGQVIESDERVQSEISPPYDFLRQ